MKRLLSVKSETEVFTPYRLFCYIQYNVYTKYGQWITIIYINFINLIIYVPIIQSYNKAKGELLMKVLFIGNSHTYVHYVPLRVSEFFKMHGQKLDATMLTYPGVGLDWHLENSQTYFNLMYGNYDAVILQHNAHPFPGKESLVTAGKAVAKLVPENTEKYVYMTWSEKKNPEGQEVMSQAYEALAEEIDAKVCPVGRIWQQIIKDHPEAELYFEDGEHSSLLGASLSASVIGRTLLGMKITSEVCFEDAKNIADMYQDPRMIDMFMQDGELIMK